MLRGTQGPQQLQAYQLLTLFTYKKKQTVRAGKKKKQTLHMYFSPWQTGEGNEKCIRCQTDEAYSQLSSSQTQMEWDLNSVNDEVKLLMACL